jgi:hypothetical protein
MKSCRSCINFNLWDWECACECREFPFYGEQCDLYRVDNTIPSFFGGYDPEEVRAAQ